MQSETSLPKPESPPDPPAKESRPPQNRRKNSKWHQDHQGPFSLRKFIRREASTFSLFLLGLTLVLQSYFYHKQHVTSEIVPNILISQSTIKQQLQELQEEVSSKQELQLIQLKIYILTPGISSELASQIAKSVHRYCEQFGKDPDLILAIIRQESNFNPQAVSNMQAMGLMQIFPSWASTLCKDMNLLTIDGNIRCGIMVYSYYEDTYKSHSITLAAYNRGPTSVDIALANKKDPTDGYSTSVIRFYEKLKTVSRIK